MIEVREFFNPTVTPAQFSQLVAEAGAAEIDAMRGSVAERLNALAAIDPDMQLSHETIYRSLFIQTRGVLKKELTAHLRTARQMRQAKGGRLRYVFALISDGARVSASAG